MPGSISDGEQGDIPNTLVKKVESGLLDQIKVVRLDSTEVIKGAVIGVIDITVLEDGPDSVCEAVFVGQQTPGGKLSYIQSNQRGVRLEIVAIIWCGKIIVPFKEYIPLIRPEYNCMPGKFESLVWDLNRNKLKSSF